MLLPEGIWWFFSSVLGKRLGKSMGSVAKEVKGMSQEDILAFERAGEVTITGHCLKLTDIKVLVFFTKSIFCLAQCICKTMFHIYF